MGITNAELLARWPSGRALAEQIRAKTGTVILSFSAGKDSLAAWLLLRELGFDVVPVYKWLVPGLLFVERSLAYYESFFGTRIRRYPHPSFYRWQYLDGRAVAAKQGVSLPPADVPFALGRADRLLAELSLPLDD